jgi:flagellar hook-basal body complex protein FliE
MSSLSIENLSGNLGRIESLDMGREANVTPSKEDAKTFSALLKDSFEQVNQHQVEADTAIKNLVAGRTKNIHETLLAVERADSSLKMAMQVRNKILDAYKEIMRMQV